VGGLVRFDPAAIRAFATGEATNAASDGDGDRERQGRSDGGRVDEKIGARGGRARRATDEFKERDFLTST